MLWRMKERAEETRPAREEDGSEGDVLAKIAEMAESDRVMAGRLHAIIKGHRAGPLAENSKWAQVQGEIQDGRLTKRT